MPPTVRVVPDPAWFLFEPLLLLCSSWGACLSWGCLPCGLPLLFICRSSRVLFCVDCWFGLALPACVVASGCSASPALPARLVCFVVPLPRFASPRTRPGPASRRGMLRSPLASPCRVSSCSAASAPLRLTVLRLTVLRPAAASPWPRFASLFGPALVPAHLPPVSPGLSVLLCLVSSRVVLVSFRLCLRAAALCLASRPACLLRLPGRLAPPSVPPSLGLLVRSVFVLFACFPWLLVSWLWGCTGEAYWLDLLSSGGG